MAKIFSILAFGALFGLFPLALFYGGIFVNYFEYYGIREFFNSFFMQNLNLYFYAIFGLFSGIAFVVNTNILRFLYLISLVVLSLSFVPSVGKNLGDRMFFKDNVRLVINGAQQKVRIIYKDNYKIYYNTRENPSIIRIERKKNANR